MDKAQIEEIKQYIENKDSFAIGQRGIMISFIYHKNDGKWCITVERAQFRYWSREISVLHSMIRHDDHIVDDKGLWIKLDLYNKVTYYGKC